MPPTIPSAEELAAALDGSVHVAVHLPTPRELVTTVMLLLHGFGDSEAPFASLARNMNLPGVLAIAVRGVALVPPSLLPDDGGGGGAAVKGPPRHFHWGDDLSLDTRTGRLDLDQRYERAGSVVMEKLVRAVLLDKFGWEMDDILLFGFAQGGSVALGLASGLRTKEQVEEAGQGGSRRAFKGVISIGGALPASTIPSMSGIGKTRTPVLVCRGSDSEELDDDAIDLLRREFAHVRVATWKRSEDGMPRNREEMYPVMQFISERLPKMPTM